MGFFLGGSPKKIGFKGGGGHIKKNKGKGGIKKYFSITLRWDMFNYFLKMYIPTETNKASF